MIDFVSKVGFPVSVAAFLVYTLAVQMRKDVNELKDSIVKSIDKQTETLNRVLEEVIRRPHG